MYPPSYDHPAAKLRPMISAVIIDDARIDKSC